MTAIPKLIPIMTITVSVTVRGRITAEVSTDGLYTAMTAGTAVMNMPVTRCPMVHGLLPVHPSISGLSPAPADTVPRKQQAIL